MTPELKAAKAMVTVANDLLPDLLRRAEAGETGGALLDDLEDAKHAISNAHYKAIKGREPGPYIASCTAVNLAH